MYPQLVRIGNFTLYTHGVLSVLGIILGAFILYRLAKKNDLTTDFLFDNLVYAVLIGIIGARLAYFFIYRNQFSSFSEIFFLWQGGMVSYGGFIPGVALFAYLLKMQKQSISRWLSLSAIAFPAGLFFGRLGNIFAGEHAGITTNNAFNISGYVPVTLYEAVLLFGITIVMLFLYFRKNDFFQNFSFLLMVTLYSGGRFVIDFWRDEITNIGQFSVGQLVSLFIMIVTIVFFVKKLLAKRS